MLSAQLFAKLVLNHLPSSADRKALRCCCRALRVAVDGLACGATVDLDAIAAIPSASDSISARLLRSLQRLRIYDTSTAGDADAVCWQFGTLHLSALKQLTRLELRCGTCVSGSYHPAPLLRLISFAPASLRELCIPFDLWPEDALPAFTTLAGRCPQLQSLYTEALAPGSLQALTDQAWPQLRALRVSLQLAASADCSAGIRCLARLSQLTKLQVSFVPEPPSCAGLAALSRLSSLRDLALNNFDMDRDDTDAGGAQTHWLADVLRSSADLTRLALDMRAYVVRSSPSYEPSSPPCSPSHEPRSPCHEASPHPCRGMSPVPSSPASCGPSSPVHEPSSPPCEPTSLASPAYLPTWPADKPPPPPPPPRGWPAHGLPAHGLLAHGLPAYGSPPHGWPADDERVGGELPRGVVDALGAALVELDLSSCCIKACEAAVLQALPHLAALAAERLLLDPDRPGVFASLRRLDLRDQSFGDLLAPPQSAAESLVAAEAAFPQLESCAVQLVGGDFPVLPRLRAAMLRLCITMHYPRRTLKQHAEQLQEGLAGIVRCMALRRLTLNDVTSGVLACVNWVETWHVALPQVEDLAVWMRPTRAERYFHADVLQRLVLSFPRVSQLALVTRRLGGHGPIVLVESAFEPLHALHRLLSLRLVGTLPTTAAMAQLLAGLPGLQRVAVDMQSLNARVDDDPHVKYDLMTCDLLAGLQRSVRPRVLDCEPLSEAAVQQLISDYMTAFSD